MPARRALLLLRPIFAKSGRACHSCQGGGAPPPCPPCESAPAPPCRAAQAAPLPGRRVVCCPPPQGKRPPCPEKERVCSLTCAHQLPQAPPKKPSGPNKLCGAQRDVVAERIRCYEEHHRRVYEDEVKERRARPRTPPPPLVCPQPPEKPQELATDGRIYAVAADGPAPRCSPAATNPSPKCPTGRPPHPPPQPITLEPLGDCRPKERPVIDPCAHTPRTILSIDRGDPKPKVEQRCSQPPPPKPCKENPKNQTENSYKGITSRIMDSIRSTRASPSKPKPQWCSKPPALASAPKRCRQPTLTERMRRGSPSRGTRKLHTSSADLTKTPQGSGREAALAASKKLEAALKERESLKEAGRGRSVSAPSCAPPKPPPPPPRPAGGAMEFSVPEGVDTVCVRVSMGKRPNPPEGSGQATKPAKEAAAAAKPTCPPPSPCARIPCPPKAASDSWLSIKKIQQKISSCGRDAPAPAPATAPPKPRAPTPCPPPPQNRTKMVDVLPHTIFVK